MSRKVTELGWYAELRGVREEAERGRARLAESLQVCEREGRGGCLCVCERKRERDRDIYIERGGESDTGTTVGNHHETLNPKPLYLNPEP